MTELLVALVFVSAVAAILVPYLLLTGKVQADLRQQVEGRLRAETHGISTPVGDALVKALVDRIAADTVSGSAARRWLEESGVTVSLGGLVAASALSATLLGIVSSVLVGYPLVTGACTLLGLAIPTTVVKHRRTARIRKFEEQFPEALDMLSRAVRSGHALGASLKMTADELNDPVGSEFRTTFDEQNFGLPLADALEHLAHRMPLLDVRFFITAVLIQRDTGGNLAEILDNLASIVRERFKIRRQVRVHTAHGRMTGYVLLALPPFLIVVLWYINPDHMKVLFQDHMGQTMLVAATVMQAVGFLWIRQVIKIEV
jgi:tight adherence protein B